MFEGAVQPADGSAILVSLTDRPHMVRVMSQGTQELCKREALPVLARAVAASSSRFDRSLARDFRPLEAQSASAHMSDARTDPHAHALGPGRAADAPRTDPSTLAAFAPAAAPSAPVQGLSRVHSSAANSVGSYGQPAGFARPLQRVIPPQQHRLAGSPLARPPASAQPPRCVTPSAAALQWKPR